MKSMFFLILISILFSFNSYSQQEDDLVNNAILDTQAQLKSADRGQLLQSDQAQRANDKARDMVGSESLNDTYAVSAEILPVIMQMSGSPEKAAIMLEEASKNPEAFFNKLPPEIRTKISQLSKKVDERKNKKFSGGVN